MFRIGCIFIIIVLGSCRDSPSAAQGPPAKIVAEREGTGRGEPIPVYDYKGLETLMKPEGSTVYVVNFWATWCAPCIKEMPFFEQISKEYPADRVLVTLVSLDVPQMWETRLVPFVEEQNLISRVVILDDPKQNTWIPRVDPDWSGAIPATLIYNRDKRVFFEQPLTYETLKEQIDKFLSL